MSGGVVIEPGAVVEHSTLTGPVLIGTGATVRHSALGPNVSVGPHARIEGAALSDSLIDEGAQVLSPSRPLTRAVIGRRAVVGPPTESGLQIVVGDHSVLRV